MNLKNTMAVTGLIAVLGAAGVAGSVVAQDQGPAAEGGMMQGMDHGQMMEGMDHGGATGDEQAQSQGGHDAHGAAAPAMPGSPATEAYRAANQAMHAAMDIEFSDNADIDFARGMIGHHQGAIDMARIVLEHGEDPDLRQLAEEIIEAQEAEIAFLQNWIAEHAE
jgi:uncharacterized protein (DUF305 family)